MAKVVLEGNADAVEFCPNKPYAHILAAASYTLQEGLADVGDSPARVGGLYLFAANQQQQANQLSSTLVLTKLYHQVTSGVFDVKWCPYDTAFPCLAQASADGSLCLHTLKEVDDPASSLTGAETSRLWLHEKARKDVSTSMCLYVDWNPTNSTSQVALSHSDGSVSLIDFGQCELETSASWQAHDFEAWVVTYDFWKPAMLYSGGDDSHFCAWDLREDPCHAVFKDKKTHKMGVCSIQSNPLWENVLVTGSYDENIRLWDLRMIQKPLMKVQLGLGGGVWRVKWHHSDKSLILAACMHNGFAIARVFGGEMQVVEEYHQHNSLAYGASWYRGDWENAFNSRSVDSSVRQSMDITGDQVPSSSSGTLDAERGQTRLSSGTWTERDSGSEERLAANLKNLDVGSNLPSQLSEKGVANPKHVKNLVATCSFYDKALHLWVPRTLAFSTS